MNGQYSDVDAISILSEAVKEENLVQLILHTHLLLERGLERQIAGKSVQMPKGFNKKLSLYVNVTKPPKGKKRLLSGFNNLRNKIAHMLEDEEKCVWECLPWDEARGPKPNVDTHVLMVALELLNDLREINETDFEEQYGTACDKLLKATQTKSSHQI